jgi:LysM repeat protein
MKSIVLALVAALLVAGLIFSPAGAAACGDTYTVKKGDYLRLIASTCGVTLDTLVKANPEIKDINKIYPGQVIRTKVGSTIPVTGGDYVVVRGDTLSRIALNHGTTVQELLKLNTSITNASKIYVGQVLKLPVNSNSRVVLSTRSARAGGIVDVKVTQMPANANIDFRLGIDGQAASVIMDGKTSAAGEATARMTIPATAKVGERWVVKVLTTDISRGVEYTSLVITIVQ